MKSFDAVGIPGFQFIQDPLDYGSRTHHSNMDTYERLQPDDLKQAATVEAIFVYNTAMRDQMLPRKPLPHPELEDAAQGSAQAPDARRCRRGRKSWDRSQAVRQGLETGPAPARLRRRQI